MHHRAQSGHAGTNERAPRRPAAFVVSAALAVLLMGAASACSSNSGTTLRTSPAQTVKAAATKAAQATTVHMEMTETLAGPVGTTINIAGDVDQAAKRSHLTTKTSGLEIETIQDHNSFYVRASGSGKWTRVNLPPSLIEKVQSQFNPAQGQLALLQKLGVDVKEVGTITTDGTKTTHYAGPIDWRKLLETVGGSGLVPTSGVGELESNVNEGSGSVDVYIDDQGRVRQTTMTMSLTARGHTLRLKVDGHFSRYDEPVDIKVPPASEVAATKDATNIGDFGNIISSLAIPGSNVSS